MRTFVAQGAWKCALRIAYFLAVTIAVAAIDPAPAVAQFAGVSNTTQRPFVTGLIPVVGPGGTVGGVSIDAQGVVAKSDVEQQGRLREARLKALEGLSADVQAASKLRKISLRGLAAAIDERRRAGQPATDELQNLVGLQRVEFVFVYPEQQDIVLAGIAEGWQVNAQGHVVGQTTGRPVLQLDDLVVALRTAKAAARGDGITCSIDPTPAGLARLQKVLSSRSLAPGDATITRLEQALGPQQITLTGVAPGSHFAHVLVAADFLMKRLAMNFEPAPIDGLPSYLELLQTSPGPAPRSAAPRFWLAVNYDPLLKDESGLAWQLRGSGVQALTEEGRLTAGGAVLNHRGKEDPLAKKWTDALTAKYEALAAAAPVFGELRNCMDLAVVAALLTKENLPGQAGCDLAVLLDDQKVQVAEYHVPKTLASRASLTRKGREWIVSVSGGVDVDSWSVLHRVETDQTLAETRAKATPDSPRWWWD